MRTTLVMAFFGVMFLVVPHFAFADGGYGSAGCGLGSIVIGNQSGMVQILAATTNGTSGTQTFGITSGTSNCDADQNGGKKSASLFITANRDALEKDISRGNGETVSALSGIMGCRDSTRVGAELQRNFEMIFPNDKVSTDQVVHSILNTVKGSPTLAKSCNKIA